MMILYECSWFFDYKAARYEAWNLAVRNMPFSKIDPLK